jgi:hypothetical protein
LTNDFDALVACPTNGAVERQRPSSAGAFGRHRPGGDRSRRSCTRDMIRPIAAFTWALAHEMGGPSGAE